MTYGNSIFPFNNCNNNDLITINNSNICTLPNDTLCDLPDYTISEQAFRASNLNSIDFDCDVNLSNLRTVVNITHVLIF